MSYMYGSGSLEGAGGMGQNMSSVPQQRFAQQTMNNPYINQGAYRQPSGQYIPHQQSSIQGMNQYLQQPMGFQAKRPNLQTASQLPQRSQLTPAQQAQIRSSSYQQLLYRSSQQRPPEQMLYQQKPPMYLMQQSQQLPLETHSQLMEANRDENVIEELSSTEAPFESSRQLEEKKLNNTKFDPTVVFQQIASFSNFKVIFSTVYHS